MRCSEERMMRRVNIRAGSHKRRQERRTLGVIFLLIVLSSGLASLAEEKPVAVSYDLMVTIEPKQGTISVRGNLAVPVEADAKTLRFGLHETFAIKKLLVNDRSEKSTTCWRDQCL